MANAKALGIGRASDVGSHVLYVLAHKLHVRFDFWALRRLRDACWRATQRMASARRTPRERERANSVGEAKMATEPLTERHRELLEVLAIAPHGSDVNALLTRGFKLETMADLVRSELAAVRIETMEKS